MKQVVDQLRQVLPPEALDTDPDRTQSYRYGRAVFCPAGEPPAVVLALGHAVGTLKRDWLRQEIRPVGIAVQRAIKAAMYPGNILNPGRVVALGDL